MSAKYGLLGLLSYGDQSGYDLNRTFSHSINNFWHTQTSQIYKELTSMEKVGWLTSHIVYQEDKPNRKVYSITELGREELHKWLDKDFIEKEMRIRNLFLIKVFFLGENKIDENILLFKEYKARCEATLNRLEKIDSNIENFVENEKDRNRSLYWKMTARYGDYYYKMCIEWANEMVEILEKEKTK
ncbi:PadR family transcriptional regulator [Breznakia sp. OttesenSCG-928-G09]|nr:PadR family transcriptional regulator [Breznakia sp. OttesenSCG-928-G09]